MKVSVLCCKVYCARHVLRDGPDMQRDLQRAIAASLKDQGKASLGGGDREGGWGVGGGGGYL
jgi:hypothetical protein